MQVNCTPKTHNISPVYKHRLDNPILKADPKHRASKKIQDHIREKKLFKAIENGDLKTIKSLVYSGVNVNATNWIGNTPLGKICTIKSHNCREIMEFLIENGANINHKDCRGKTPLIYAAQWSNTDAVTILLEKKEKLDINHQSLYGKTALTSSLPIPGSEQSSDRVIFESLIDSAADINLKTLYGNDVFWDACIIANKFGKYDALEIIFRKTSVDINHIYEVQLQYNSKTRCTALMQASLKNDIKLINFLLEHNADPFIEVENLCRKTTNETDEETEFKNFCSNFHNRLQRVGNNISFEALYEDDNLFNVFMSTRRSSESHFSALSCVMNEINFYTNAIEEAVEELVSTDNDQTNNGLQQQCIGIIYKKMTEIDPENKYTKSINRFKENPTCSITQEGCKNPHMIVETAHVYERMAIQKWFDVNRTCPITNIPLDSLVTIPLDWFEIGN